MNQYMIVYYNSSTTTFIPAETLDAAYSNLTDLLTTYQSTATEADTLSIVDTIEDVLIYYQHIKQDTKTESSICQPKLSLSKYWQHYIQPALDRFSLALR